MVKVFGLTKVESRSVPALVRAMSRAARDGTFPPKELALAGIDASDPDDVSVLNATFDWKIDQAVANRLGRPRLAGKEFSIESPVMILV